MESPFKKRQSNPKDEGQSTTSKSDKTLNRDGLYAILRRQAQRIAALETQVSTLRRDLNRIERKSYRDAESGDKHNGQGEPVALASFELPASLRLQ